MKKIITVFFWFVLTIAAQAQSTTFTGLPSVKITEGGVERSAEKLDRATASSLSCVIKEKKMESFIGKQGEVSPC